MVNTQSKEREAFEAAMLARLPEFNATQRLDGSYQSGRSEIAWLAWQASRAQALGEAVAVCLNEHLVEPHGREDAAYDLAIDHCEKAIKELK